MKADRRDQQQIQLERLRTSLILGDISDAVIAVNALGYIELINEAAQSLLSLSSGGTLGRHISEVIELTDADDFSPLTNPILECIEQCRPLRIDNAPVLLGQNHRPCIISATATPLLSPQGECMGAVMILRDISSDYEMRQKLKEMSQLDLLTGLLNRYAFNDALEQAIESARNGEQHALFSFDLDQFKVINDTFGHQAGDGVLNRVSRLIESKIPVDAVLARLDGDEFALLCKCASISEAEQLAEQIIVTIKRYIFSWEGSSVDITLSTGIMLLNRHAITTYEAMRQVSVACFIAKKTGGNRFHTYLDTDASERASFSEYKVLSEVRTALTNDRFMLYFQPLVASDTGQPAFYEVLIRMTDSGGNILLPNQFIPVAERSGLMREIDLWVIQNAMEFIAKRERSGQAITLSINLHGTSIGSRELLTMIADLFRKYSLTRGSVILEITETVAIEHMDLALDFIEKLRAIGCLFAIDDFGAGFSSFHYLKHLPAEYVKIDGSFVKDVLNDSGDEAMVRAIHQVAQALGKKSVAEFVEDEQTAELLRTIGIDYLQGYHFGRPDKLD